MPARQHLSTNRGMPGVCAALNQVHFQAAQHFEIWQVRHMHQVRLGVPLPQTAPPATTGPSGLHLHQLSSRPQNLPSSELFVGMRPLF